MARKKTKTRSRRGAKRVEKRGELVTQLFYAPPKRDRRVVVLLSAAEEKRLMAAVKKAGGTCCAYVRHLLASVIDP